MVCFAQGAATRSREPRRRIWHSKTLRTSSSLFSRIVRSTTRLAILSLPDANPPMNVDGLSDNPNWLADHANNDKNKKPVEPFTLGPNIQTIIDPPHDL